jgi:hypothetical protein
MELVLTQLEMSLDDDGPVVFHFRCNRCKVTKAYLESGVEHLKPAQTCEQCKAPVTTGYQREGSRITMTDMCGSCGHVDVSVLDLDESPKIDSDFATDRERFCLSQEEGAEYREQKANIGMMVTEWEEKEHNKLLYAEVANTKKLTTAQLERLLIPELDKAQYRRLELHTPQTEKGMFTIAFTAEDVSDRGAYDSRQALQKVLSTALAGTNWRLTTDGTVYQLGVLSGRLRGFEHEDELLELVLSRRKRGIANGQRPPRQSNHSHGYSG